MGKVVVHRHTPPSRIALYWTPDERGITSARFSMPMTSKRSPFSRDAKHHRCQSAKMASMERGREKEAFLKGTAHKGLLTLPTWNLAAPTNHLAGQSVPGAIETSCPTGVAMHQPTSFRLALTMQSDAAEGSIYVPASVWVFARRGAGVNQRLDPAVLESIKRQVTLEAQALDYRDQYTLTLWQEEDGKWSVV